MDAIINQTDYYFSKSRFRFYCVDFFLFMKRWVPLFLFFYVCVVFCLPFSLFTKTVITTMLTYTISPTRGMLRIVSGGEKQPFDLFIHFFNEMVFAHRPP